MNNQFRFVQTPKISKSHIGYKTNRWKTFFKSPYNIILFATLILFLTLGIIALFLENEPFKNQKTLRLDENILPLGQNTLKTIKYGGAKEENQITLEIFANLQKYNVPYEIKETIFGQNLVFSQSDYIKALYGNHVFLFGTDSFGKDVFVDSLQQFIISVGISAGIFSVELIFGLYIGIYLAWKTQNPFTKISLKMMNVLLAIPDIIMMIVVVVFIRNIYFIYIFVFLTGLIRMIYWAYQYSLQELNSNFIDALWSQNVSLHRIIYKHITFRILGRILILFIRRIGYIIFLIATLDFIGVPISYNVAITLKNNWVDRDLNPAKIIFPTLFLFVFLVDLQFLAIRIAKVLDNFKQ
ncbi:ABC transporter permease subunit [Mycoplasmopsis columbinasalis]|uniref:Glutathione transport system permease protein gsiD n=1 Tax=Mycoplasmopsis columbinasalis TaxID=114880 RepID=A0A449BA93_9BACT|nr:ABC transporter permease subunit [Mycoplasmopsis columbinasalis]VEU78112.1 Glutathione transport system permease protein gsiD [Mycoplasmopsis columbinasalis]